MKNEISDALIKRYLDKACSEEEERIVEDWYQSMGNDLSKAEMSKLRNNEALRVRMLHNIKVQSGLSRDEERKNKVPVFAIKRFRQINIWKSVAAIVLVIFTYSLFKGQFSGLLNRSSDMVHIENSHKTILKHQLPDGSILWMAPQSSIQYADVFGHSNREMAMEGDIFFEIEKDPKKPFIIKSGELKTKVLGTSFRIRTSVGAEEEISVVSGMVAVSRVKDERLIASRPDQRVNSKLEVLLTADQKVRFNKKQANLIKSKETPHSSVKMWKRRSLSFEDEPLTDIVRTLDSTFNVQITLQDKKLADYTLNADFSQLNLVSIMEIVSQSLNLQYEISGNRIRLSKHK